jgi:hypothetical protein
MKVYKIELICFDPNGDCDFGSMLYELKNLKYFCSKIISAQSHEIGEWSDDQPVNIHLEVKNYVKNATWEHEDI